MKRLRDYNLNTQEYWDVTSVKHNWLELNYNHTPRDIAWEVMKHIDFGEKVLDVGAGSGMIIRRIKEVRPNLHISACDYSHEAIKFLKERVPLNEIFWCDATKGIPKEDKSYDIVISTEVIEHLEEPKKFIEELVRLAKHKVIITTPYGDNSDKSEEHVWAFWLDDLWEMLSPYGMVYLTVASGNSNMVAVCELR